MSLQCLIDRCTKASNRGRIRDAIWSATSTQLRQIAAILNPGAPT